MYLNAHVHEFDREKVGRGFGAWALAVAAATQAFRHVCVTCLGCLLVCPSFVDALESQFDWLLGWSGRGFGDLGIGRLVVLWLGSARE